MTILARRRLVIRTTRPDMSLRVGVATLVVLLSTLLTIAAFLAVGVGSGDYPLTLPQLAEALLGTGDDRARYVVWQLRLPRLLVAAMAGVAFAIAGLVFQSTTRNPLVAPDIVGVSGGAAVAAIAVIVFGWPGFLLGPAACLGGLVAGGVLAWLASGGGATGRTLVLVGIGVAAVAEALVGYLVTRGDLLEVQQATIWLVGSLYAASWADAALLGAALAIAVPVMVLLGRPMLPMELGDETAAGLGVRTDVTRRALLVLAVVLASIAVATTGPIAFVAFLAPNIGRRLARTSGAGTIVAACTVGALLVLAADIVARRIVAPTELPVGIVTILLGAPYFLYLLARSDRVGVAA
jgi:iron complex transport system permease protein